MSITSKLFFILLDKSFLILSYMKPKEGIFPKFWLYSAGHATSSKQRRILTAQESAEDELQRTELTGLNRKSRNQIIFWPFASHNSP